MKVENEGRGIYTVKKEMSGYTNCYWETLEVLPNEVRVSQR